MSIWNPDLTTRMGAETAGDMGGLACFIFAGLCGVSMAISVGALGYTTPLAIASLAILAAEAVLAVSAGFRLRAGSGAFLGAAMVAVLVLELIGKVISVQIGVTLLFNLILLIVVFHGVRGAFALRKAEFTDEDAEAFQ